MGRKQISKAERIYVGIRNRILTGELTPGAKLCELDVAREFAACQAPAREAIKRLGEEGLVKVDRYARRAVATLTAEEIRDVCIVRSALIGIAACVESNPGDAIDRSLDDVIEKMAMAARERSCGDFISNELALLRLLVRASGNRSLFRQWSNLEFGGYLALRESRTVDHLPLISTLYRDAARAYRTRNVRAGKNLLRALCLAE